MKGKEKQADSGDSVFCFQKGRILLKVSDDGLSLPKLEEIKSDSKPIYLLDMDGVSYFGLRDFDDPEDKSLSFFTMKDIRTDERTSKEFVFLSITAYQLMNWYNDNRYCGSCASETTLSQTERAILCPNCGRAIYPRIVPAVIVGVTDGDRILLTKYNNRNIPYYALIAGFTEIGESLEGTVEREVMEEVGLKVKNITYYKSQPWGIVDDILSGFYCEVDGSKEVKLDDNELKLAVWTERQDIIAQPDDFSLTNEMMIRFRDGYDPYAPRRKE